MGLRIAQIGSLGSLGRSGRDPCRSGCRPDLAELPVALSSRGSDTLSVVILSALHSYKLIDTHSLRRYNVLSSNDGGGRYAWQESDWYRPRHDELGRGRHGRRAARRHRQPGRRAHDAVGRGVHQGRRAARRSGRQAAGGHEPREHGLLDQALHGPPVRRGVGRSVARAVQGRARRQRRRVGRRARPASTRRPRSPRWCCRS